MSNLPDVLLERVRPIATDLETRYAILLPDWEIPSALIGELIHDIVVALLADAPDQDRFRRQGAELAAALGGFSFCWGEFLRSFWSDLKSVIAPSELAALEVRLMPVLGALALGYFQPSLEPRETGAQPLTSRVGDPLRQGQLIERLRQEFAELVPKDAGQTARFVALLDELIASQRAVFEDLRRKHELAEGIIAVANVIILILDVEGRIVRFNPYMSRLSGYSLDEVRGCDWFETFLPEADQAPIRELFGKAVADVPTEGNINPIVTRSGERRDIEWFDRALKGADDEVIGLLVLGLDVTEQLAARRKIEQANASLAARVEVQTASLRKANVALHNEIAAREVLELERERSYQLLVTLFDHTSLMLAYLDTEFNFLAVNRAYAAADSKEPQEMIGRNHFELYPNETNRRIFEKVLATGEAHYSFARPFEYALNPERGVSYWDWSLTPIKAGDGTIQGLILSLLDVTERVQMMESLHASEQKYRQLEDQWRTISELTSDYTYVVRLNRNTLEIDPQWFSKRFQDTFGGLTYTDMDRDFLGRIHPDDRHMGEARMADLLQARTVVSEYRVQAADGQWLWLQDYGRALPITDEPDWLLVLGAARDITAIRQAEEEIALQNAALHTKDWAIHTALTAIAIGDLDARLTYVNPAFLQLWGYESEAEVLGRFGPALFSETAAVTIGDALRSTGRWQGELVAVTNDGKELDVEISAHLVTDADGVPSSMMASINDITSRKQTEKELLATKERLLLQFNSGPVPTYIWQRSEPDDFVLIDFNHAAIAFDQSVVKAKGIRLSRLYQDQPEIIADIFASADEKKNVQKRLTYEFVTTDRKEIFDISYVYMPPDMVMVHTVPVTDLVRFQDELEQSLAQKDFLLQEIQHRVKNSLQTISSLLFLQSLKVEEPPIHKLFRDARSRVRALSLVHEKLYLSAHLSQIDLPTYISSLVFDSISAAAVDPRQINIDLDLAEITCSIDTACQLGLALNELMLSVLFHSFPYGQPGSIWIRLETVKSDWAQLTVAHDGAGLSEADLDADNEILDFGLVQDFVRQIGGEITFKNEPLVEFQILFVFGVGAE